MLDSSPVILRDWIFSLVYVKMKLGILIATKIKKKAKYFTSILIQETKSNALLYSLYYTDACNEFAGPISTSLRPGNTASFEEMSRRWKAVGNTVSNLTSPRIEPHTYRSRDERVIAWPTGRYSRKHIKIVT